jgi:hypothetical protein
MSASRCLPAEPIGRPLFVDLGQRFNQVFFCGIQPNGTRSAASKLRPWAAQRRLYASHTDTPYSWCAPGSGLCLHWTGNGNACFSSGPGAGRDPESLGMPAVICFGTALPAACLARRRSQASGKKNHGFIAQIAGDYFHDLSRNWAGNGGHAHLRYSSRLLKPARFGALAGSRNLLFTPSGSEPPTSKPSLPVR